MKNLFYTFIFLFIGQLGFSQGWEIGLNATGQINKSNYTLTDNFLESENDQASAAINYGISLEVERKFNPHWSVQSGLSFSQLKFRPEMYLPWAYGTSFPFEGRTEILFSPYLSENNFDLLTIPLAAKFVFNPQKRWQLYSSIGLTSNFQIKETEVYSDEVSFNVFLPQGKTISYTDPHTRLFSFGLDWSLGLQVQLNPHWKVLFSPSFRILEYRKANEKFKRNGEFLHDDQLLHHSQANLSVGIRRQF